MHSTGEATRFVRDLFTQYGAAIEDIEVRRASLEDTYVALVQRFESGQTEAAVRGFTVVPE